MTDAAVSIHQQVVQEGIEVDSDEYYNEVNSRLGSTFLMPLKIRLKKKLRSS